MKWSAVALTLVLSAPLFIKMYKYNLFCVNSHGLRVHTSGFNLRLDDSERFADISDAIRTRTPVSTVIVTEDADSRRAIEDELFRSTNPVMVSSALDRILTLKRPVVVIVDNPVHRALQGWLIQSGRGQVLFQGENLAAWLIQPN